MTKQSKSVVASSEQSSKSNKGTFWFFVTAGLIALFVFASPVSYTATEVYTEQEPYTDIEYYTEQVPVTEQECHNEVKINPLSIAEQALNTLLNKKPVEEFFEVCENVVKLKDVQRSREVTKYRTVEKQRSVTKQAPLYQQWTGQAPTYYRTG